MVREYITTQTGINILGTGRVTNSMGWGSISSPTENAMKVNLRTVPKTEKASTSMSMETDTRDPGLKTRRTGKELIITSTLERNMRVNGTTERNKARVFITMHMAMSISVSGKEANETVQERLPTNQERSMKGSGKMIKPMERE